MDYTAIGRVMLVFAIVLLITALLFLGLGKLLGGRMLPGDFVYRRDGITIAVPIIASIMLSIILTILVNLVLWLFGRGR